MPFGASAPLCFCVCCRAECRYNTAPRVEFRYNGAFFLTGLVTMEINPILNTIKDLRGRSETIRGYL